MPSPPLHDSNGGEWQAISASQRHHPERKVAFDILLSDRNVTTRTDALLAWARETRVLNFSEWSCLTQFGNKNYIITTLHDSYPRIKLREFTCTSGDNLRMEWGILFHRQCPNGISLGGNCHLFLAFDNYVRELNKFGRWNCKWFIREEIYSWVEAIWKRTVGCFMVVCFGQSFQNLERLTSLLWVPHQLTLLSRFAAFDSWK